MLAIQKFASLYHGRVCLQEAGEAGRVVAGDEVIQPCLAVALLAGELVVVVYGIGDDTLPAEGVVIGFFDNRTPCVGRASGISLHARMCVDTARFRSAPLSLSQEMKKRRQSFVWNCTQGEQVSSTWICFEASSKIQGAGTDARPGKMPPRYDSQYGIQIENLQSSISPTKQRSQIITDKLRLRPNRARRAFTRQFREGRERRTISG